MTGREKKSQQDKNIEQGRIHKRTEEYQIEQNKRKEKTADRQQKEDIENEYEEFLKEIHKDENIR